MNYQENYSGLRDDELLMIAASRSQLVPDATLALDSEMSRRGLTYEHARAKKREVGRAEYRVFRKHNAPMKSNYFVAQTKGWVLLLSAVGVAAFVIGLSSLRLIEEEWEFPIMSVCMGALIALVAVKPWLRQKTRFWISLLVSCAVQLPVGYWISVHLAPRSRGEMKGAWILTVLPGYIVGITLFRLLQTAEVAGRGAKGRLQ